MNLTIFDPALPSTLPASSINPASLYHAFGQVPVILGAMGQEHERAVGGWQAEWVAIPDLFCFTAGAVEGVCRAMKGLQVDAGRMKANLDRSSGLVMAESLMAALAARVGRPEAYRIVQGLCKQVEASGQGLRQVAQAVGQVRSLLSAEELNRALDPGEYLGSTEVFINRALASYHKMRHRLT
jgi:3-carboxy-cis,cis-muconate cycloisomerase